MKAQGQCRATLETFADIKNPRHVAFVKQANIAQNQQVNNAGEFSDTNAPAHTPAPAREKNVNQLNELLTDTRGTHENPMDTRTTRKAGASNPHMSTVAKGLRATND